MAVATAIARGQGVITGSLGDRMAKFLGRYPHAKDIYVTSAIDGDHGAVSHHYGLKYKGSPTAALDISAGTPPDDVKMRDFAKWLYENCADFSVELIHSTPFADDEGFYVKNQLRNPGGSIYGGPQAIGHFDHIHWATSEDLMTQLEEADKGPALRPEAEVPESSARIAPAPGEPAALVGIANNAPVWGWDASDYDWDRGPMDLVAAQRDGISFFIHKATEGTTWKAQHYKDALERARNAGIPVLGTYHFLWPDDVEAQVKAWMDYVDAETPWWKEVPWIWQIDAEQPQGAERVPNPDEIRRAVAAVKARMQTNGTAGYVIVYAPRWAYKDAPLDPSYDIWNSDYNGSGSPRPFAEQYKGVTDFQVGWNLMSGRKPRILQFSSDGKVGRQQTCDVNKFDGDLHALIRLCGRDPGRIGAPPDITVTEKVLPFDRSKVPQETDHWCGPAATQVVLNSRGIIVEESVLADEIGTYVGGTDTVEWIDERALDKRAPDAGYTSVHIPDDPPTDAQRDALWANIVRSIDAGYGVIMNWVAPPNNYPRGVKGSVSPSYGGGTIYHYVACMGYDTAPGARALYIADSGFDPHEYWISFDQAASLIPPKAYTYAAAAVTAPAAASPRPPAPAAATPRPPAPAAPTMPKEITTTDAQDIKNAIAGVRADGSPLEYRVAHSRYPRDFNQIINDRDRGPWHRTYDGTELAGHTDAYEQIVPINEQIAWTHVFSDGINRDSGDVLLEVMEFVIQWRKANNLPTSAFTQGKPSSGAVTAAVQPAAETVTKRATGTATKRSAQRAKRN